MTELASHAFASGALVFVIVIVGAAWTAVWIWLAVVLVQFLRTGTKAFYRYLAVTELPQRPEQHQKSG